jgi:dolichol-phosphate mannosyltransferase
MGEPFKYGHWDAGRALQHRQHHRRADGDDVQLRAEQLADLCRQASARLVPLRGWFQFALACSLGILTNVGAAAALKRMHINDVIAVLVGIVLASVWNFALSSKFVWGKYGN